MELRGNFCARRELSSWQNNSYVTSSNILFHVAEDVAKWSDQELYLNLSKDGSHWDFGLQSLRTSHTSTTHCAHRQCMLHQLCLSPRGYAPHWLWQSFPCLAPLINYELATAPEYLSLEEPRNAARRCRLTLAMLLRGFWVGFGAYLRMGWIPPGFGRTHTRTHTLGHGCGFSGVQVRIALENPRVTRANPYWCWDLQFAYICNTQSGTSKHFCSYIYG